MTISIAAIVFMVVGFSIEFGGLIGGFIGNPLDFSMLKGISYDLALGGGQLHFQVLLCWVRKLESTLMTL